MDHQPGQRSDYSIEHAVKIHELFDKSAFLPFGRALYTVESREVHILQRTHPAGGNPDFCVLKQITLDQTNDGRELRESHLLEDCRHDNILRLFQWEIVQDIRGDRHLHLYSERCEKNLFHVLKDSQLSQEGTRNLTMQMLMALDFLHKRNIMHRDMKPENILVNNSSDVNKAHYKLADFGLARYVPEHISASMNVTICGTEGFWSPEVHRARERHEAFEPKNVYSADIFSLGLVVHVCVTRKCAFTGWELSQSDAPKAIPDLQRITDDTLQNAIKKMLTWQSESRPTAEELLCQMGMRSDIVKMGSDDLRGEYYSFEYKLPLGEHSLPKLVKIEEQRFPQTVVVRHLMLLSRNQSLDGHEWQNVKAISRVPKHPNVLQPLGLWRQKLQYALIEKAADFTLEDVLFSARIRLTQQQSQTILDQIHEGLNHLLAHGIVHGSLELKNIVLEGVDSSMRDVRVQLRGFGLVSKNGSRQSTTHMEDTRKLLDIARRLGEKQNPSTEGASMKTDSSAVDVPRPAQAFDEISLGQDTGHNDDVRKPMGVAQHLGKQKRPPSAEPVQIMNPSSEDGLLQRLLTKVHDNTSSFRMQTVNARAVSIHLSRPNLLVVGTQNGKIVIFSLDTMAKIKDQKEQDDWMQYISSNNQFIVFASDEDRSVSVLDKKNNLGLVKLIKDHQGDITCVSLNEDFLLTAATDKKAKTVKQAKTLMFSVLISTS